MGTEYWVSEWAQRRIDELISVPADYIVHSDFLNYMDKDEIKKAFTELNNLFYEIYKDIALCPESFGMPLNPKNEFRIYSKEWRDSGDAPYRPFILLYNLFSCGTIQDNHSICVSAEKYRALRIPPKYLSGIDQKVRNQNILFNKLIEYGFFFEGLKNNRVSTADVIITYPDNDLILILLKLLTDKARKTDRISDFLSCHFRLLQDDMNTADYGYDVDVMVDRVSTEAEREFCYKFDDILTSCGFCKKAYRSVECYGLTYYHNETLMNKNAPYTFRILSRNFDFNTPNNDTEKMRMLMRIRNVSKCMEYLNSCPDSVKDIFTAYSNTGCAKHANNTCVHGVGYEIEGVKYWRCACCEAPFRFKPNVKDILHYLKLIELGEER